MLQAIIPGKLLKMVLSALQMVHWTIKSMVILSTIIFNSGLEHELLEGREGRDFSFPSILDNACHRAGDPKEL